MSYEFKIERTTAPKAKPQDESKLGFGKIFTDHMFIMNYDEGQGWHDGRVVPYGPLQLDPSSMVFHYAQELFEGLKAYRTAEGKIQLFRPQKNIERMNNTCDRLCVPRIDPELALEAIKAVVEVDKDWVPHSEGTSLYIRPFIIATDPFLGVHPAHHLMFIVIMSPVGSYNKEGINPVKIYVERNYVRAVKGGMGFTKTGGNYSASLKAQDDANKLGYAQVLWLDGVERKYVEEVGTMNVFFKINGEVITPSLEGTILSGITRMSCLELLRKWGYNVSERKLPLQEIIDAAHNGTLEEAFGTGTAAVISPIGELFTGDEKLIINEGKIGPTAQKLYDTIVGMQNGVVPDDMGWLVNVN